MRHVAIHSIALGCSLILVGAASSCDVGMSEDELEDELGDFDDWSWDDENDDALQANANSRVTVRSGSTNNPELIKTLPIGRSSSGAPRRVVMRLTPSDIPKLAKGDRLIVPVEAQVTTRCDIGQSAPGCNYSPSVAAQLILTGSRDDTNPSGNGSKALSNVKTQSCSKNEHHCMVVFQPGDTNRELQAGLNLPCVANNSCFINLVMWAWDGKARSSGKDKLLIGENEGNYLQNGKVSGDKGRMMVVRERSITGSDRQRRRSSGSGTVRIPTNTNSTLVYSHRLKKGNLKAGEQFVVEAKIVVNARSRARFSTLMFAAKNARATSGGIDKISPKQIGEHNGVNCTGGTCVVRKVTAFRVESDISGPVFVNVIARSAVPGGGSTRVEVQRGKGFVRSTRYRAVLNK